MVNIRAHVTTAADSLEDTAGERDADLIADLVRRARAGDRHAFDLIVERCAPMVAGVARRYLANPADVEDVVQEVWLRLLEHLHRIETPEAARAWLCRVTTTTAWAIQRRGSRATPTEHVIEWEASDDTEEAALRRATRVDVRAAVRTEVERLRPVERRLIELLMTGDRPDYRAVSEAAVCPIGSIGPTRLRALERLRRRPAIARLHAEVTPVATTAVAG